MRERRREREGDGSTDGARSCRTTHGGRFAPPRIAETAITKGEISRPYFVAFDFSMTGFGGW